MGGAPLGSLESFWEARRFSAVEEALGFRSMGFLRLFATQRVLGKEHLRVVGLVFLWLSRASLKDGLATVKVAGCAPS
jgi:hypothetical protein